MGVSAARELVLLQSLVETNLKLLGYKNPASLFIGEDGDGYTTLFVNYTDGTYSTNDVAAFVRLIPAGDGYASTMFTLSHAGNEKIDGSVSALVLAEGSATASPAAAQAKFVQDLVHCLRGTMSMPVVLALATNGGTLPAVNGINGASSSVIPSAQMELAVYGRGYVGGV